MPCKLRHPGAALALAGGLVLACGLGLAPPAHARDYHVIATDDAWQVGTGTDDAGNPYCAVQDQSAGQTYGLLLLLYPLGDDPSFELHVFKNSWSIPGNAAVPATFNFSNGGRWRLTGAAASDGSSIVDYEIGISNMKGFLGDFANSRSLEIDFVTGNEPAWTANLAGTSQAALGLLQCTDKLLDAGGGAAAPSSPPP